MSKKTMFDTFMEISKLFNSESFDLRFQIAYNAPTKSGKDSSIMVTVFDAEHNPASTNIYEFHNDSQIENITEGIKQARSLKSVSEVGELFCNVRGF